jgi:hypothetical protein
MMGIRATSGLEKVLGLPESPQTLGMRETWERLQPLEPGRIIRLFVPFGGNIFLVVASDIFFANPLVDLKECLDAALATALSLVQKK